MGRGILIYHTQVQSGINVIKLQRTSRPTPVLYTVPLFHFLGVVEHYRWFKKGQSGIWAHDLRLFWTTVYDAGPTLIRHSLNGLRLQGDAIALILGHCWLSVYNVWLTFSHRLTNVLCWLDDDIDRVTWSLSWQLTVDQSDSKHETLTQYWFFCWRIVGDDGPTLNQLWYNVSCLLGSRAEIKLVWQWTKKLV